MIGIIGAMDIEIDALKNDMTEAVGETISGIEFTKGRLYGVEAVVAVCGIGKVFAAICAQTMILRYGTDCIINTGVGGSLSERLNVGSIAVAESTVQHDMDTSPLGDPKGLISGINIINIPADRELLEKTEAAVKRLGINTLTGVIASGDRFVAGAKEKKRIKDEFGAIACEMEGAAIGHVCYVNNVPFAVIRSISDNANGDAAADYPAFRIEAAEKSKAVVARLLKSL